MSGSSSPLHERVLAGDRRAAGRIMRLVDDDHPDGRAALEALHHSRGGAYVLGLTGNPGAGKSSLADQLIHALRQRGDTVGCIAIDPTSPFSGGAILGDRVRMGRHATDDGVFIRSVATRGNLGGVSRSTPALMTVLDAMGFDWILVETVGVGQDEVDIAAFADTCVVVSVPGLGDDVQAAKAGLLEVADVLVVNKADRPGAQRVVRELKAMLDLSADAEGWRPPIVETVATQASGIDALMEAIDRHRSEAPNHEERLKRRARFQTRLVAAGDLLARIDRFLSSPSGAALVDEVVSGARTPFSAATTIVGAVESGGGDEQA